MLLQENMSSFRMHQSVQQFSVNVSAYAHTGTDSDVEGIFTALRCTEAYLSQHGPVDIRIKTYRNLQCLPEGSRKIVKSPCQLRRTGDISVGSRFPVQIHRAEAADAQRLKSLILKIFYHLRYGNLRGLRGKYRSVKNIALLVPYGAYHLGAAGFYST